MIEKQPATRAADITWHQARSINQSTWLTGRWADRSGSQVGSSASEPRQLLRRVPGKANGACDRAAPPLVRAFNSSRSISKVGKRVEAAASVRITMRAVCLSIETATTRATKGKEDRGVPPGVIQLIDPRTPGARRRSHRRPATANQAK